MRRRLARAVVALVLAGAPVAVATGADATTVPPPGGLALVDETFNAPADGNFDITVQLPASITPPIDGFRVVVSVHREVREREQIRAALDGDLRDRIDGVTLEPSEVLRPTAARLRLVVPMSSAGRTRDSITLDSAGVYPVHVELQQDGVVTADLVTFVHRLPTTDEPPEDRMPVAMVMSTTTPVRLDTDAAVVIDDATRAELDRLAGLLEHSGMPVTVRIPPAVLDALFADDATEADQELGRRLASALVPHSVLSSPVLPLDVSQAAQAGEQQRYTQWLRDGEDATERVLDNAADRTLTIADRPISQPGGLLLRDLGARMLVVPRSIYDSLPNTLGGFTDSTQLVQLQVSPGVTVDAAIPDQRMSDELATGSEEPLPNAIRLVAELLAARAQVVDQGGDPERHSILLATPDISLPAGGGFAEFTSLLASTSGIAAVDLDTLSTQTDELLSAEGPVVVDLPPAVDSTLEARVRTVDSLSLEALSAGSMLPPDDQRDDTWGRLIDALPTSALDDDQAAGITADLRAQFAALRQAVVVPSGFPFNLTGTTGSVPFTLQNTADIPLTVRIRMSSSKLEFPNGDQTVTLAPQSFTEVRIDMRARSNGESPVTLEVFTPLGDTRIAPPVPLTASISALSGIGNLVTGAALLVLLTWWVRHIRRNRRQRDAAHAVHRHPAAPTAGAAADPDGADVDDDAGAPDPPPQALAPDDDALSPDAATSTLPPP